jgi:hypothetical protein
VNRRVLPVIGGLLVVGAAIDWFVGYAPFPGYSALLGLVGTILITLVSKRVGAGIQRPESYYPDDRVPDVQPDLVGDAELRAQLETDLVAADRASRDGGTDAPEPDDDAAGGRRG